MEFSAAEWEQKGLLSYPLLQKKKINQSFARRTNRENNTSIG